MKITHTENINGKIVAKGKLVLIKIKDADFDTETLDFGERCFFKPIIISETEQIQNEDHYLYTPDNKICQYYKHYNPSAASASYNKKIIALPHNFSEKTLQNIVEGEIKDGDEVYLECGRNHFNIDELRQRHLDGLSHQYSEYILQLTLEGHVTLVEKIEKPKGIWKFERSSGYPGYRCDVCATWIYENQKKQCKCDQLEKEKVIEEKIYTKTDVITMLQDTAIHFGVTNVPKDDGTVLDKINEYIKSKLQPTN